jgi:integrase
MSNRSVGLYLYASFPGIGWRYCKAAFERSGHGGRIKPHVLLRPDGTEEPRPDAVYYLGYRSEGRKVWEKLGNAPATAARALEKKRAEMSYVAAGGSVKDDASKTNLVAAIDDWLEIAKEKLSPYSHGVKKLVMDEFLLSYGKKPRPKYVEDIRRVDALRYLNTYLKKQGNGDRTRCNKYLHLRQFLVEHHHDILKVSDAPKYGERDPEVYTDEQIAGFFSKCDPWQHVLFLVFYSCGLRLGEVQTLRWRDINLKERFVHIDERPEYGWKPKKWHVRDIPISRELATHLSNLKALAKYPLVFHTSAGKPVYHMLDMCKRVARRAGIPAREAWLHKWRATYCVELMREGVDLPSIQALMGHKDLQTTARYCAPMEKTALRDKLDKVGSFNRKSNGRA